jgi:four helix bundle protein
MSDELKRRTRKFALDTLVLSAQLAKRPETQHVHSQVLRASSSVAANYRAACRARSRAEFISKLGTVEEETDESLFWLEMLRDVHDVLRIPAALEKSNELTRLIGEADQLLRIVVSSKKTAREGLQGKHE